MAYTRIRDDSPVETASDAKEPPNWAPYNESRLFSYRNLLGATLALWVATSAALGWILLQKTEVHANHAATPLPFPPVPLRVVAFDPDSRFHYTAIDKGEEAWLALLPNDGGIVSIDQPQKYQLPTSYEDRNKTHAEVYAMSMFHQIHCLNSIRIRLGTLEGFIDESKSEHHPRNVFLPESHVEHCFDYLRQAIMCAGDLTLEHSVVPDEFGFNGWGTSHQCADWKSMWGIAVEHRYDQSTEQQAPQQKST